MGIRAFSGSTAVRRGLRASAPALVALTVVMSSAAGCVGPRYVVSRPLDITSVALPDVSVTRSVVLVSIDGLRADAIDRFAGPTLRRLMQEGSYSLAARTIMPSTTLPSHTSMLTGELPARHRVLWNNVASARARVVESPTVFSIARAHGYRTAAFFSKAKFHALQRPGTLDYSQAPGGWFGRWSGKRTVEDVAAHLESGRPNVLFVHLSDPDAAGHSSGWMSEAYGRAVRETDAMLEHLLSAAERAYGTGDYTVIVTADHGGHDYGHGTDDPRDVTIPWIAWGRGVKAGPLADLSIETVDTAPTVLWLLGVEHPPGWDGTPVVAAFHAPHLLAP